MVYWPSVGEDTRIAGVHTEKAHKPSYVANGIMYCQQMQYTSVDV